MKLAQLSAALRKSVSGFRLPEASHTGTHRLPGIKAAESSATGTFRRASGNANG
jgi:hypothetical protein